MSQPQFPDFPQTLPKTQADWSHLANVMRDWQTILQPVLQLLGTQATSATAGSAGPLPATPATYLNITINGTPLKIAGYNP